MFHSQKKKNIMNVDEPCLVKSESRISFNSQVERRRDRTRYILAKPYPSQDIKRVYDRIKSVKVLHFQNVLDKCTDVLDLSGYSYVYLEQMRMELVRWVDKLEGYQVDYHAAYTLYSMLNELLRMKTAYMNVTMENFYAIISGSMPVISKYFGIIMGIRTMPYTLSASERVCGAAGMHAWVFDVSYKGFANQHRMKCDRLTETVRHFNAGLKRKFTKQVGLELNLHFRAIQYDMPMDVKRIILCYACVNIFRTDEE